MSQCIESVACVHNAGYIHRYPKSSNFAVGKEGADQTTIYLRNFGLCRKYVDVKGAVIAEREKEGFRGTVRYASLTAHEGKELSRRDDLWSLFYLFVELITGRLPWKSTNDKDAVAKLKTEYAPEVLSKGFPSEIAEYVKQIRRLQFADKPDYPAIYNSISKMLAITT